MTSNDPPCSAVEAVQRAQSVVGKGGQYVLGTGNYKPKKDEHGNLQDHPWTRYWDTESQWYGVEGSDCAGFAICWAWKLVRYRPGFNRGAWSSVTDNINCNSALEDGLHEQSRFVTLAEGASIRPGDLLLYPTFSSRGKKFIGHVSLVEKVPDGWNYGQWSHLTVIQCHGPNGFKPGVVRTDGSIWNHHDSLWGKPEHRSRVVRPKERT